MSWSLPKLPGFCFEDPTRTQYHVSRKFEVVNGFNMPRMDTKAVGGLPMDVEGSGFVDVSDASSYDPSLTYGRVKKIDLPVTLPHYVHYDKKKLSFRGFLRQSISESPLEYYRIRPIVLIYFLEDDTILISEPGIENSGLWHGKLVKRGKLAKNDEGDSWHWKDLNVGIDIPVFGKVFHLVNCDDFTKEFLESQGVELADEEQMPEDPYMTAQMMKKLHIPKAVQKKPENLRRFLQYDGKVLKFDAIWDDTAMQFGEMRPCQVFYYLVDDTISVKECHTPNDGRDPVSTLLRKMRIPKDWKDRTVDAPFIVHEPVVTPAIEQEFYRPTDLVVGSTVRILGRPFVLIDCDPFTRSYYKQIFDIEQPEKILNAGEKLPCKVTKPQREICEIEETPTFDGSLTEPIHQDVVQMHLNSNKTLRYLCEMIAMNPESRGRKFLLSYYLSNGFMKMNELPTPGYRTSCFSRLSRIKIPGSNRYYTPELFYIDAVIVINQHRFRIIGTDLYVYKYMQENPDKFPPHVIDSVRNYHLLQGNLKHDVNDATEELQNKKEVVPEPVKLTDMELCMQNINALPPPPIPYEVPTVSFQECGEYHREKPCQLPKALQGIRCPEDEDREKPVVCFAGPALPLQDKGASPKYETKSKCESPAISQCKKTVTFAESPTKNC